MNQEFKRVVEMIKSEEMKKTKDIGHVSYYMVDKTPYSFHFYAVYENDNGRTVYAELFYDLRNKVYYMNRNGKPVNFNVANLDTVVPRIKDGYFMGHGFNSDEAISSFFDMVEVPDNTGMYKAMLHAVGAIGNERVDMTSRALIRLITEYSKLELMYKAGVDIKPMFNYAFRSMVYRASAEDVRKIHQIFGVSKAQFKFLAEFTKNDTGSIADLAGHARLLKPEDMDKYRAYQKLIVELEEKYNIDGRLQIFNNNASFSNYIDAVFGQRYIYNGNIYGGWDDRDFFGFIYHYNFTNPTKLIEYLLFECYVSQGIEQFRVAMSEYRDYYRMCHELQYERFEKYPRYLKTYHDIVTRNYVAVEDKVANENFIKATEQYKELETVIGDYAIIVPETPHELVYEGNVLQHCVGSYIKKVSQGKSMIVFLREKKTREEPLVTVEIRGDEIVQVRGQANRVPTNDEKDVMRKFAKRRDLKIKSFV